MGQNGYRFPATEAPSCGNQKKNEEGKDRLSNGEWRYDEATTQYAITINGETTSYSLFSTDDINTCMLFKGDIASADLRESWFTTMGSPDEYDR